MYSPLYSHIAWLHVQFKGLGQSKFCLKKKPITCEMKLHTKEEMMLLYFKVTSILHPSIKYFYKDN